MMDDKARRDFVESWGSMGALWGINRSMARIHALLLATREPLGLEEITEQLEMSRGNASVCLKELRHWGVIRRIHLTGERRDYYIAEEDIWSMLFRIAEERKKREFEPALAALREAMVSTGKGDDLVRERYVGIRPAPGYPACPDHSEKLALFHFLNVTDQIGVSLTESCAMVPASSVSKS